MNRYFIYFLILEFILLLHLLLNLGLIYPYIRICILLKKLNYLSLIGEIG